MDYPASLNQRGSELTAQKFNRAVVLGAGGFLGVNLVAELVHKGFEVVCSDRVFCSEWPAGVRSIIGDISAIQPELLAEMDNAFIFHLASSCKPTSRTDAIENEIVGEVLSTVRLLESTKHLSVHWIYASSGGTVYGQINTNSRITENSPTEPISSYGVGKLSVERYFALYRKIHQTSFSIARIANPFGPWQNPFAGQGIVATLIYKGLSRQPIEIWGDGENIRDYIYISDVVRGLVEIAECGKSGEVYNLGSQAGASVNQLVALVEAALGAQLNINYLPARASDVRYSVLDTQKLFTVSSWKPTTKLEDGIEATVHWMRSNLIFQ